MTVIAQMGALLLQGAATAAQTTMPVTSGPGWYVLFTQITSALSVLVFLVLMLILIPALVKFRKTAAKLDSVLDHVQRSIEPVTTHAMRIADNVDYISASVRADVQELRKTLLSANSGIRDMIASSEQRLHELSALLRVVQEEAEQAFVSTAATIRGVRAGAATLRDNGARVPAGDDSEDDDFESLDDLDDGDFEGEDNLEAMDDLEAIDDDYDDDDDIGIETINDLDAAEDAAEDLTNGDDNGSAFGRAKPRIKRTRRSDRG
jgi:uncharacterized protein YoxC